jgi:hypothetical protein
MSSSYDSLPFCSGTEISSLCVGIPSCRTVVADSLVNLKTSAFALLVLLICRAIIWCKVVFGTDKNTAGKRKQVKMNYARKRLRKQSVGQKNDWSLKEQTSTFTETVLSTVREVRDTVLRFFLGNTAAQKSEKTVDINSLSYLPSVVWVAHIVSVLFVITFINYTLESTRYHIFVLFHLHSISNQYIPNCALLQSVAGKSRCTDQPNAGYQNCH